MTVITDTNPLPTKPARAAAAVADRSGSITSGGTAQSLMAQNLSRVDGIFQNQSTGDLWLRWDGTNAAATQPAFWAPAGFACNLSDLGISTEAVTIYGATTGQAFAAREW